MDKKEDKFYLDLLEDTRNIYKDWVDGLQTKVNQLELDVDSYKTKYERANELYLDTSKKLNQLETNRDEAIEYIKNHIHQETYTGYMDAKELMKLLSLLERGKE